MDQQGAPFDDIKELIASLPPREEEAAALTRSQLESAGFDKGDVFHDLGVWYSAWSGRSPGVYRAHVTLFAGTHKLENELSEGAVADQLLDEVTQISSGDALANRLCHQHGFGLKYFDLALQLPVGDIREEAALDEKGCVGTIGFGMEAVAGGGDLLCISSIEHAPTLSALAMLSILQGLDVRKLKGLHDELEVHLNAITDSQAHLKDNPLALLMQLGGRETSAICGAILAARTQHLPVVVDGVTGLAALAVLHACNAEAIDHCKFAQSLGNETLDGVVFQLGIDRVFEKQLSKLPHAGVILAGGIVKSACLAMDERASGQ